MLQQVHGSSSSFREASLQLRRPSRGSPRVQGPHMRMHDQDLPGRRRPDLRRLLPSSRTNSWLGRASVRSLRRAEEVLNATMKAYEEA